MSLGGHWDVIGRALYGGHWGPLGVIGTPLHYCTRYIRRPGFISTCNGLWSLLERPSEAFVTCQSYHAMRTCLGALRIIAPRALRCTSGCNSRRCFERSVCVWYCSCSSQRSRFVSCLLQFSFVL